MSKLFTCNIQTTQQLQKGAIILQGEIEAQRGQVPTVGTMVKPGCESAASTAWALSFHRIVLLLLHYCYYNIIPGDDKVW